MFAGGNVFYALLPMFPRGDGNGNPRIWLALTARFIVGMGTGIFHKLRHFTTAIKLDKLNSYQCCCKRLYIQGYHTGGEDHPRSIVLHVPDFGIGPGSSIPSCSHSNWRERNWT